MESLRITPRPAGDDVDLLAQWMETTAWGRAPSYGLRAGVGAFLLARWMELTAWDRSPSYEPGSMLN